MKGELMSQGEKYVIALIEEGTPTRYYSVDGQGYPSVDTRFHAADFYDLEVEAQRVVDKLLERAETGQQVMSGGTRRPHEDISRILDVSSKKPVATASLQILMVDLVKVGNPVTISGKIEEPTGYTYD